jgi:signal peptidase I
VRAAALDRRVKKEARALAREARLAVSLKKGLRGKNGYDLETVTDEVEQGLAGRDLGRVRRYLPILDSLVDELIKAPPKSTTRDYFESIGAAVLIALALRAFVIEAFKIPSSSMYPTLEIGDHIFVNKFIYGVRIPYTRTKLFELRGPKRGEVIVFIYPCEPDRDYIKRVVATAGDTVEVRCNVVYVNGEAVSEKLLEDSTQCSYDDVKVQDDPSKGWETKSCSLYSETVPGHTYEVYQDPGKPLRDELERGGKLDHGDERDFPRWGAPSPNCQVPDDPESGVVPQVRGKLVETKPEGRAGACEPQLHYVVPPGHVFAMGDNRANSNDSRIWGSVPLENIKGKALFLWLSYKDYSLSRPWDVSGLRWSRIGNFVK